MDDAKTLQDQINTSWNGPVYDEHRTGCAVNDSQPEAKASVTREYSPLDRPEVRSQGDDQGWGA